LHQYLNMDGTRDLASENLIYQGLLLRDQKYLRKNMQKIMQLSVKDSVNKIVQRRVG